MAQCHVLRAGVGTVPVLCLRLSLPHVKVAQPHGGLNRFRQGIEHCALSWGVEMPHACGPLNYPLKCQECSRKEGEGRTVSTAEQAVYSPQGKAAFSEGEAGEIVDRLTGGAGFSGPATCCQVKGCLGSIQTGSHHLGDESKIDRAFFLAGQGGPCPRRTSE